MPALLLALAVVVGLLWLGPPPADAATDARPPPPPAIDTAPAGGKPTLILLHGAGLNAHMWDAVNRELDPRWRVIAIDLPGHGALAAGTYSVDRATDAVAAAARRAAPSPVVLVGDSLGGYTAMEAAAKIPPAQLRGLVVGGATEDFPARLRLSDWASRVFIRWLLVLRDPDEMAPKALEKFGVSAGDRAAIVKAGMNLYAVERSVDALLGTHPRERLAAIPQPILFVNGDGDTGRIAQEADYVHAAPRARAIRYADTGHGVSMRSPARFASDINEFAAQAFPPSPPDGLPLP